MPPFGHDCYALLRGDLTDDDLDGVLAHAAVAHPAAWALMGVGDESFTDADVHAELDKIYALARRVRSGEWKGVTGKPVTTVVNVGIGLPVTPFHSPLRTRRAKA